MPKKIVFSQEQLDNAKRWLVEDNISYIELARRLGICRDGGKRLAMQLVPGYVGNQSHKGYGKQPYKKSAMDLIKVATASGRQKINRLIEEGYKTWQCEWCGKSEWNGHRIPLELHHKDFNHWNNEYDNLEILCPNCHQLRHTTNTTKNVPLLMD